MIKKFEQYNTEEDISKRLRSYLTAIGNYVKTKFKSDKAKINDRIRVLVYNSNEDLEPYLELTLQHSTTSFINNRLRVFEHLEVLNDQIEMIKELENIFAELKIYDVVIEDTGSATRLSVDFDVSYFNENEDLLKSLAGIDKFKL